MRVLSWIRSLRRLFARRLHKRSPRRYREELFPNLFVRQLEQRRVLSTSPLVWDEAARQVIVGAGAQANDSVADTFHVVREGDQIAVSVNGQQAFGGSLEQVNSIRLEGSADQDTLILDLSGGSPIPAGGIQFNAGGDSSGADCLLLDRGSFGAKIDTVTHRFERIGDGSISLATDAPDAGQPSSTIAYTGVESILDASRPDRLAFRSAAPQETVTLSDDGIEDNGLSLLASSEGVPVTFASPHDSLTIETSSLDSGDSDTIEVAGLDSTFAADLTIRGDSDDTVSLTGAIDLHGANLDAAAGSIHGDGTVASQGATLNLDAGTGALSVAGSIRSVGGNITLTSDSIAIDSQASIAGAGGTLVLQPHTVSRSLGIADGAAGDFQIDTSELARLENGFAKIIIGQSGGAHRVTIGTATFRDPVEIRAPGAGGSIHVLGHVAGVDDASITLSGSGSTTYLSGDIVTSGTPITYNDSVVLQGNVLLDTTNGGTAPTGADITITGATDATDAGVQGLTLRAGSAGLISLADVGTTTPLGSLTLTSGAFALSAASNSTGATTVNGGTLLVNGSLTAASNVTVNAGGTLGGTGAIGGSVTVNSGGKITGGTDGAVGALTVGSLSFDGGAYRADLIGAAADQIVTSGTVDLANPGQGVFSLNNSGSGISPGDSFTLISKTSAGPIAHSPLSGAAEGATVTVDGKMARYSYGGGSGNDFTLTMNSAPTDVTLSNAGVAENQPAGTLVGTLSATDPDAGDTHTFSLVPGFGDNALFAINGDRLETAQAFDFETRSSYSVKIRAEDLEGLGSEKEFEISVTDAAEAMTAGPGAWTDAGLTLSIGPDGRLHLYVTDTTTDAVPAHDPAMVTNLVVNGRAGNDDQLTVDFSAGNPIPSGGLSYAGGAAGADSLVIDRGSSSDLFHTVTHVFTTEHSGVVSFDPDGPGTGLDPFSIQYFGLEPVDDNMDAADRIFTFTGGAETIELQDHPNAGQMTIDSTLGEMVTFSNPTQSLTINADAGDEDAITVTSVDPALRAALTVNGDAYSDIVNLNATLALGSATSSGNLSITAKTINLNSATINTDAGATAGKVTFSGAVTLGANVTIDTDATNDNDVSFTGTVNADDAATYDRTLTVNAGSGTVTFGDVVGGAQALADLDVAAETINLNATAITVDDQGGNAVVFNGAVVLGTSVAIDTDGTSDNSLDFSGTINADAAGSNRSLQVTAGAGDVSFQGAVGDSQALQTLTVNNARDLTFSSTVRTLEDLTQLDGSGTTTLNGSSGAGVGGDLAIANDAITLNSGAIIVAGSATLEAQTGDVTVGADIWAGAATPDVPTLWLKAANSILVNGGVSIGPSAPISGKQLHVIFQADADEANGGAISMGSGSSVNSNGGNVTFGGGPDPANNPATGTSSNVEGILLSGASLTAGTGNISLRGNGQPGAGSASAIGVHVTSSSTIQTTSGAITICGTGGSGDAWVAGVVIDGLGALVTSADGGILITGTGGTTTADGAQGVYIGAGAGVESTGTATVTIDGTGGGGDEGVRLAAGILRSTLPDPASAGKITVTTDTIWLSDWLSDPSVVRGQGELLLQPKNAGTSIGLGNSASGTFHLDAAEIGMIQDGFRSITIGRAADGTGAVEVKDAAFLDDLVIVGGSIALDGLLSDAGNTVTLTAREGAISDGGVAGNVAAASLVMSAATGIAALGDPLETAVDRLEASGGSGGVFVDNAGGLTIGGIGGMTGVSATGGAIRISAAGPLVIGEDIVNSGDGSIRLNAAGGVTLNAAVSTSAAGTVSVDTTSGTVSQTAAITTGGLLLTGAGTFTLDDGGNNVATLAANVTGPLTYQDADGLTVGTVLLTDGITTGGHDVTLAAGSLLAVDQPVDTSGGSGGKLSIGSGVTVQAALTLGAGNITLNGGGSEDDVVITSDQSVAGDADITARRDVIVRARLQTTSAGNIALTAGSSGAGPGAGGVWIDHNGPSTGELDSAGTISIWGKDLFATASGADTDAIRLEGSVIAAGTVTLTTGAGAPAGAGTLLHTTVQTSAGDVLINNPVTLTGDSAVANAGGGQIHFGDTVDGAFGLTINAGTDGTVLFTGAVGGATRLGDLLIGNAKDVTASAGITAASLTQAAGSALGTTLLNGPVDTDTSTGVSLTTAGAITVNHVIATTAGGPVTLTADNVEITATGAINAAETVTIRNASQNRPITLGTASGALELRPDELDGIAAPRLRIGRNDAGFESGPITVSESVVLAGTIALHLTTGSTVGGSGSLAADSLAITAGGAVTLTNASNEVTNLAIKTVGNLQYTDASGFHVAQVEGVNGIHSDGGSVALVATTGNVVVENADGGASGAVHDVEAGGAISLTLEAADALLTVDSNATLFSTAGDHAYTADNMILGGEIEAGARAVTLTANTAAARIEMGGAADADAPGVLFLTETELNTIHSSGALTLGSATNAGGIVISAAADLRTPNHLTGPVTLRSHSGSIAVDAPLLAPAALLTLETASGSIRFGHSTGTGLTAADIVLSAEGGAIEDNAPTLLDASAAGTLTMTAKTGIGGAGGVQPSLDLDATTVLATNGTLGGVHLNLVGSGGVSVAAHAQTAGDVEIYGHTEAVTLTDVDAADGDVSVTLTGQDLVASDVLAGGSARNVTLTTATSGNIEVGVVVAAGDRVTIDAAQAVVDGNGVSANATAADLVISSGGNSGIGTADDPLETAVSRLEASGGTGGVYVSNDGPLTIGGVTGTVGVSAMGSDIRIRAASPLTVNEDVVNFAGGHITLAAEGDQADDDLTVNANVTASGGDGWVNLFAGDTISLSSTATVSAAGLGGVLLAAGANHNDGAAQSGNPWGDVAMADGATVRTEDGSISLMAPGSVQLSAVDANADGDGTVGDVYVVADYWGMSGGLSDGVGAITDGSSSEDANLVGNTAILWAATGIGSGDDIDTNLTALDAVNSGTTGHIQIHQAAAGGAIDVQRMAQTSGSGTGDIPLTTEDGSITVLAAGSGVTTAGSGKITLQAGGTNRDLAVEAVVTSTTGTIQIDATREISSTAVISATGAGAIDLNAGGNVRQEADITSAGGAITVDATAAEITMKDGTTTRTSGAGAIAYRAAADVVLSVLSGASAVDVTAAAGAISERLTGEAANVLGATATLWAAAGIGGSGDASLDTDVAVLRVSAGQDVGIREATSVQLGDAVSGVTSSNGSIAIATVDGSIGTGNTVTTTGGNGGITLTSGGANAVTLSHAVTAHGSGPIDVNSGAAFTLADGVVMSSGSGPITVDTSGANTLAVHGDVTTGGLGTITLTGSDAIAMDATSLVETADGNIVLDAAAGGVVVDQVRSTGNAQITITATAGAIAEADNTAQVGNADSSSILVLNAGATIGGALDAALNTDVAVLRLTAGGNVDVAEANAIQLGDATGDVSVTAGNLTLGTANGPITTGNSVTTYGSGSIALSSGDGGVTVSHPLTAAEDVVLSAPGASGNVTLDETVTAGDDAHIKAGQDIRQSSGDTFVIADTLAMEAGQRIGLGPGADALDVRVNTVGARFGQPASSSAFYLNQDAAGGTLTIGKASNLIAGGGATIDGVIADPGVAAGGVTITTEDDHLLVSEAISAAGGSDVTIQVNDLDNGDGVEKSFTLSNAATITAPNLGAIRITADNMTLDGAATVSAREVALSPLEPETTITLGSGIDGNRELSLTDAELSTIEAPIVRIGSDSAQGTIRFPDAFTSDAAFATDFLELRTGGTVTAIDGPVVLTGDLAIRAGGSVDFGCPAGHRLKTVAVAAGQDVTFVEDGDFSVGNVDGLPGITGRAVSLTIVGPGYVVDNGASTADVTAESLLIVGGLGVGAQANPLETEVDRLAIQSNASSPADGVFLQNRTPLTIDHVGAVSGVSTIGARIDVEATHPAADPGLTLNAPVDSARGASGPGGSVRLVSDGDLLIGPDGLGLAATMIASSGGTIYGESLNGSLTVRRYAEVRSGETGHNGAEIRLYALAGNLLVDSNALVSSEPGTTIPPAQVRQKGCTLLGTAAAGHGDIYLEDNSLDAIISGNQPSPGVYEARRDVFIYSAWLHPASGTLTLIAGRDVFVGVNGGGVTLETQAADGHVALAAGRDVIVGSATETAIVQTHGAADIALRADSDDQGEGGVWIRSLGKVQSGGAVALTGSDVWATAASIPGDGHVESWEAVDGVRIDASAANPASVQVQASGNITLQNNAGAPVHGDTVVHGVVSSDAGAIDVYANGARVVLSSALAAAAGDVTLHAPVILTGDSALTTGGGATGDKGILFTSAASIDSQAGLPARSLVLDAGSGRVALNANVGEARPLSQLIVARADAGVFFGDGSPVSVVAVTGDSDDASCDLNIGSTSAIGAGGIAFNAGNGNTLTVTTTGDDVRLNGAVRLNSHLRIDATDAGSSPSGADVLFTVNGAIDSQAGEANDLTLTAGAAGRVSFNANVGGSDALRRLLVTDADAVLFGNEPAGDLGLLSTVRLSGDGADATFDLDVGSNTAIGAGGIVFNAGNGNTFGVSSTGDDVRLSGPVRLDSHLRIDTDSTDADGEGGDVVFAVSSPVDSQSQAGATEANQLTIDAGTGQVCFNADIGSGQHGELATLVVEEADGGVLFGQGDTPGQHGLAGPVNRIRLVGDGVSANAFNLGSLEPIGGTGIVFNGGTAHGDPALDRLAIFTTSDGVRLNGAVELQSDVVMDTTNGDPAGQDGADIELTADAPIDSQAGEHNDLMLNAGKGPVEFHRNVGARTGGDHRLGNVTVDTLDSILIDTAGNTPAEGRVFRAAGDILLTASDVHVVAPQPVVAASVVSGKTVTILASNLVTIDDGAVLESTAREAVHVVGKVSNTPPLLRLKPQDPNQAITPGDPTQTVEGWIGGDPALGHHLEQGANFALTLVWNDRHPDGTPVHNHFGSLWAWNGGERTPLKAGDDVRVEVGADGVVAKATITPGNGTGPIHFIVIRTYPIKYLVTVSDTVRAIAVAGNDDFYPEIVRATPPPAGDEPVQGNIRLSDSRGNLTPEHDYVDPQRDDLNLVEAWVDKRLAGEEFRFAEKPTEFVQPAALRAETVRAVPEVRTTAQEGPSRLEDFQPRREAAAESVRELYIVKVGPSGEEGGAHRLPDDALADVSGLFDKLRQQGLPNGLYRIYLRELGFPQRMLVEFYKSGQSFGEPVREPGPGSNPIQDQTSRHSPRQEPVAAVNGAEWRQSLPAQGDESDRSGAVSPGDDHVNADSADEDPASPWESPDRITHPLVGAAVMALGGLGAHATRSRWASALDRALEEAEGKPFNRMGRLSRRLRRHSQSLPRKGST